MKWKLGGDGILAYSFGVRSTIELYMFRRLIFIFYIHTRFCAGSECLAT